MTDNNKPNNAPDNAMTAAMKAASAAINKAADNVKATPATGTANPANPPDGAAQGVTAATGDGDNISPLTGIPYPDDAGSFEVDLDKPVDTAGETTVETNANDTAGKAEPRILPDLSTAADDSPRVNISAAAGKAKGGKAKTGKGGKGKGGNALVPVTADSNASTSSGGSSAPWHRYNLDRWPPWANAIKPGDAEIILAHTLNKFNPNTKHALAYACYQMPGSELFSVHDVGFCVAEASWGKPDNKSNVGLQNRDNGNTFLTIVPGNFSKNPDRTSTGGSRGNVGYHCSMYDVGPDGSVKTIRADKIAKVHDALKRAGVKIPRHMLPPEPPKPATGKPSK